jgi:hypothetical protein
MRDYLESCGIKFCPDDVARYFSFEHLSAFHEGMDLRKVFGHHSRSRQLLENDVVIWKLTKEQTDNILGEQTVYELFTDHYGYTVHKA